MVRPGFEAEYIKFLNQLREEVLRKYPDYIVEVQLYQSEMIPNQFYVLSAYRNVPHIKKVGNEINELALRRYAELGHNVIRTPVFTFLSSNRRIPPLH